MQWIKNHRFEFGLLALLAMICSGCKGVAQYEESSALSNESYPPAMAVSASIESISGPTEDRQENCPVTGAKLGSMGAPIPVEVIGRTVYVCCGGCVEKLRENPERYLDRTDITRLPDTSTTTDFGQTSTRSDGVSFNRPSSGGSSCCH